MSQSRIPTIEEEPLDAFEAALVALVLSAHRNRLRRRVQREQEACDDAAQVA